MLAIIPVMCILHLKNITLTCVSLKFIFKVDLLLSTRCKYEQFNTISPSYFTLTVHAINKNIRNKKTLNLVSFNYMFNDTEREKYSRKYSIFSWNQEEKTGP